MATEILQTPWLGAGAETLRLHWEGPGAARRVAIILHGRDGAATVAHMRPLADAYIARGWAVMAPDLPWSRATPGAGDPALFTMTGHMRAARAVIARARAGGAERLALAGHSVGAYAAAELAAEAGADHLLAVSPVLSGARLLAARRAMGPDAVAALTCEAPAMRAEMEACDAAPALAGLAAPVAVMTGGEDALTPPADALAFFRAAQTSRFFSVLPGAGHCPSGPAYRRAIEAALDALGV